MIEKILKIYRFIFIFGYPFYHFKLFFLIGFVLFYKEIPVDWIEIFFPISYIFKCIFDESLEMDFFTYPLIFARFVTYMDGLFYTVLTYLIYKVLKRKIINKFLLSDKFKRNLKIISVYLISSIYLIIFFMKFALFLGGRIHNQQYKTAERISRISDEIDSFMEKSGKFYINEEDANKIIKEIGDKDIWGNKIIFLSNNDPEDFCYLLISPGSDGKINVKDIKKYFHMEPKRISEFNARSDIVFKRCKDFNRFVTEVFYAHELF